MSEPKPEPMLEPMPEAMPEQVPEQPQPKPSSYYPSYADFGKSSRDFFTRDFQAGVYKINLKSSPSKHFKVNDVGLQYKYLDQLEASGHFGLDISCPVFPGYTSLTRWTTANLLTQQFRIIDKFYEGLTIGLEAQYNINTSSILGKFRSTFRHARFTTDANFEAGDVTNPFIGASIVGGHENYAGGLQLEVDAAEQTFTKTNVAFAYIKGPYTFHTSLDNADVLWAGLICRYIPWLELGVCGSYKALPDGTAMLAAGFKYIMDSCTSLKAKVETNTVEQLDVGLAFETKICPEAAITMSVLIDATKLDEGGHKVGLGVEFDC